MSSAYKALLESIADTIGDYRAGEIPKPDVPHVKRWISQFPEPRRLEILQELGHVLAETYFPKSRVASWLDMLVKNSKLCGASPSDFWSSVEILDLQTRGTSQRHMAELLGESILKVLGTSRQGTSSPETFIYLDDALYSGSTLIRNLRDWISNSAPARATVHAVFIVIHAGGEFYARTQLERAAREAGKAITFSIWNSVCFENRKSFTNSSDVYRPISFDVSPAAKAFGDALTAQTFPPVLRNKSSMNSNEVFASDQGRTLLESEFLRIGADLLSRCTTPPKGISPLGFTSLKTLGFGATVVIHRNCPNNAPLALWWGDGSSGTGPLAWYPLVPRRPNQPVVSPSFARPLFLPKPVLASVPGASPSFRMDSPESEMPMPWEHEAARSVEFELAEIEFDDEECEVFIMGERSIITFESIDDLVSHLEDVYNESWYANVPFEGGCAVFEDDASSSVYEALEKFREELGGIGWEL